MQTGDLFFFSGDPVLKNNVWHICLRQEDTKTYSRNKIKVASYPQVNTPVVLQ